MIVEDLYRVLENGEDTLYIMDKNGKELFLGRVFIIPLDLMDKKIYSIYAVDSVITICIDD